jgi:hypothetical protein
MEVPTMRAVLIRITGFQPVPKKARRVRLVLLARRPDWHGLKSRDTACAKRTHGGGALRSARAQRRLRKTNHRAAHLRQRTTPDFSLDRPIGVLLQ